MKSVYLVKDGDKVRHFFSDKEMKEAGFTKAEKIVSEEEFNSVGCYARIINGEIVVGKTKAEIAESEKQEQVDECIGELQVIDQVAGASRHVRDVSVSAGVVLNAVRVLLSKMAKELNIVIPEGFGAEVKTAADILALTPPAKATDEEKKNFEVSRALLLVSHFDPAINEGLVKITEAEMQAIPIRERLANLK